MVFLDAVLLFGSHYLENGSLESFFKIDLSKNGMLTVICLRASRGEPNLYHGVDSVSALHSLTCTVNCMISMTSTLRHQVRDVHGTQRSKFTSMISIHLQSCVPKIVKLRAYLLFVKVTVKKSTSEAE